MIKKKFKINLGILTKNKANRGIEKALTITPIAPKLSISNFSPN